MQEKRAVLQREEKGKDNRCDSDAKYCLLEENFFVNLRKNTSYVRNATYNKICCLIYVQFLLVFVE